MLPLCISFLVCLFVFYLGGGGSKKVKLKLWEPFSCNKRQKQIIYLHNHVSPTTNGRCALPMTWQAPLMRRQRTCRWASPSRTPTTTTRCSALPPTPPPSWRRRPWLGPSSPSPCLTTTQVRWTWVKSSRCPQHLIAGCYSPELVIQRLRVPFPAGAVAVLICCAESYSVSVPPPPVPRYRCNT